MSQRRSISVGFCPEQFEEGIHVCFIFQDDWERDRVMAKFLQSGLEAHEKVLYLTNEKTTREVLLSLDSIGAERYAQQGALVLEDAAQAYGPAGAFNGDAVLDRIREFQKQALAEGYSGSRGAGEIPCPKGGRTDVAELMIYESRLTQTLAEHPCSAICQFDARRYDGKALLDMLKVHPYAIVRGQLIRNPSFIAPEAFLDTRKKRSEARHVESGAGA